VDAMEEDRARRGLFYLITFATVPIFLWELSLGLWLVVKASSPPPSPSAERCS
jgi:hypothetical protein